MKETFPVTYSILSVKALAEEIRSAYGIAVAAVKFYSTGFNDTYQLQCADSTLFYFRVYRKMWRSLEDIHYEVDVLNHLEKKNYPAIRPQRRLDGGQITTFHAPEGTRYGVLFSEARGKEISYGDDLEQMSFRYGQAEAAMHLAMDDFHSVHQRAPLDLDFLTMSVLTNAEPFLKHRREDWTYLQAFAANVRRRLTDLPITDLPQGFCHGDLQAYHCNIDEHGVMTFYDFDCGGPGTIAYDLAVFRWCGRLQEQEMERWEPFLRGYQQVRLLSDLELASIPLFVACRYLWHISVHTLNAPDWGMGWLNDAYFDGRLQQLRQLATDYPELAV